MTKTQLIFEVAEMHQQFAEPEDSETESEQAEQWFRNLANSSLIGMYIVQDGKFRFVNRRFQKATGFSADDLLGVDSLTQVIPEDRDKVRKNAVSMLRGERQAPYEYRVVIKGGDIRWILEMVTPIQYQGKRAALGSYMDITEQKQAEQKVFEYKELDKLKSNLLSTVSHELRTPLTIIKGYSTMLLDYDRRLKDEEKQEHLITVDKATDRLTELVDHLLDLSRLEAGLLKLNKQPASISKLMKEAVVEAKLRANAHKILLKTKKGLPRVSIDARRIRQVLDNLIDNAVKYSVKETIIVIAAQRIESELLISVADQGIGIPAEELEKIFDRMYRIEQRLTPEIGGVGLGLAICKGFVEAHDGRIWVESEPEKGSTFYFSLPLETATEGQKNATRPQGKDSSYHRG